MSETDSPTPPPPAESADNVNQRKERAPRKRASRKTSPAPKADHANEDHPKPAKTPRPRAKGSRPPRDKDASDHHTDKPSAAETAAGNPPPAREYPPPTNREAGDEGESTPRERNPRTDDAPGQRSGGDYSSEHDRRDNRKRFRKSRKERRKEQRDREREREATLLDNAPAVEVEGLTEISPKGFGFLRQRNRGYQQHPDDVFITPEVVRIHGLRDGLLIKCLAKQGARGPQLTELLSINGKNPEAYHNLPYFEELTAINPNKRLALETRPDRLTTRVIDMMTPIGRGQRGLIVAPPRTGKTTFLEHIAEGILENYEDQMHLIVMLIDERPEEVTNFQRLFPQADLFASSNDSDVKNHTRMAQLAIERAKRLVEAGEHVFILLDSITRLARAFNNAISGGKNRGTQSGGIAVGALEIPRKLFAAARNTREGGSLTIIATALIQTNFKMDEAIFQEFKGTGNMELVLDRQLAQNYIYPAVDINRSGTRREELLLPTHMLEKIYVIRRGLSGYKPADAMEWLIRCMQRYPGNAQMLMDIKTSALA